jgi:hypothetical protein
MGKVAKVFSGAAKAVTQGVKAVVQPVYNATLKNIPGVDNALVGLDKAVGKSIPGGWGTVASVAASFIPGAQLATMGLTRTGLAVGLGALSGSGVMRGKHDFNLQGAIMGGAMAYGATQLAEGLQNAANPSTTEAIEGVAKGATEGTKESANQIIEKQLAQNALENAPKPTTFAESGFDPAFEPPVSNPNVTSPSYNPNLDSTGSGFSPPPQAPSFDPNFDPTNGASSSGLKALTDAGKGTVSNMADVGTGIKNLAGFGAQEGTAAAARSAFMQPITQGGVLGGIMGTTGLMALEEQQKALDAQLAAGNIAQDQYNAEKAKIDAQIATARQAVSDNPFNENPDRSYEKQDTLYAGTPATGTLYGNSDVSASKTLYNKGGEVKHYLLGGLLGGGGSGGFGLPIGALQDIVSKMEAEKKAEAPKQVGIQAVAASPWNTEPDRSAPTVGINLYSKGSSPVEITRSSKANDLLYNKLPEFSPKTFAVGGSIDDEYGMDEARGLATGNLQNGLFGGGIASFAAGGMPPRFLSGGGDGMSDSIRASIEGNQEARLADGEFVVPADVVSHIGNGSSKAGAKQLYSMMDRVRQARVGTKKQGKKINPRKYMAA